jgi:nucleotide-binding universal stress UspA family protein
VDVLVWVTERTWRGCADVVRQRAPQDAAVTLLHVSDDALVDAAHGALSGLLGRERGRDPGERIRHLADEAGHALLARAASAAGRPVEVLELHGRVERVVVDAADGRDLLVLGRDGDPRPGPHSLSPTARYVVDHATCPVLLLPAPATVDPGHGRPRPAR